MQLRRNTFYCLIPPLRPYVCQSPAHDRWNLAAIIFHVLGVVAVAMLFAAAVRGFWVAATTLPF
jgi:hypothetical protein